MKLYKIMIGLIMLLLLSGNELFSQEIKVGKVTNEIRVGPLSDNTNLTIGVRNDLLNKETGVGELRTYLGASIYFRLDNLNK